MRLYLALSLLLGFSWSQLSHAQDQRGGPDSQLAASATDSERASATIVNQVGRWELLRCTHVAGGVECEFRLTPRTDCFRCTLVLGPYDGASVASTHDGDEVASINGKLGRQSSKRFVANRLIADVPIKGTVKFDRAPQQVDQLALVRLAGKVRFRIDDRSRDFHVHFKNVPVTDAQPDSGDVATAENNLPRR